MSVKCDVGLRRKNVLRTHLEIRAMWAVVCNIIVHDDGPYGSVTEQAVVVHLAHPLT